MPLESKAKSITLDTNQLNMLNDALSTARGKYEEYRKEMRAMTAQRMADQFEHQREEVDQLLRLFASCDVVTLTTLEER